MPEQSAITRAMTITEVQEALSELVDEVGSVRTRVLVKKSGVQVAALVSIEDLEQLQQRDRERGKNFEAIERFSEAFTDVPVDEAEAEIARIIAEIRRQDDSDTERRSA